jgi:hypothetical protein
MAARPARIESPELIKELRNHFVAFDQTCRNAVLSFISDVDGTREWLRTDRRRYWEQQFRKRDEELTAAKQAYAQARWASSTIGRSGGLDELREVQKAERRKEEVERKIQAVKKHTLLLEQSITKMLGPCQALMVLLDQRTPQAIARLDQMLDGLEAYFRQAPEGGS